MLTVNAAIFRCCYIFVILRYASAQYAINSALYNQTRQAYSDALTNFLENAPKLEDIYYPAKYRLPTDFYIYSSAARSRKYTQNVIFDPCRQYGYACCNDTFGTPEYDSPETYTSEGEDVPRHKPLRDDGSEMLLETSRRPDDELYFEPKCKGATGVKIKNPSVHVFEKISRIWALFGIHLYLTVRRAR